MTHQHNPLRPPLVLDEQEIAELNDLLARLPALWRHPRVTAGQRKSIASRVITAIRVTPGVDAVKLEIEWRAGVTTHIELITHQAVEAVVAQDYSKGLQAAEISEHLNALGAVRPTSLHAGMFYTPEAAQRLINRLGLQRKADELARAHIHRRFVESASCQIIADELNALGIRHGRGQWNKLRVIWALQRMRREAVEGLEHLPIPSRLGEPVLRLHEAGITDENQIADRLRAMGLLTQHRQQITATTVRRVLKRLGQAPQMGGRQPSALTVTPPFASSGRTSPICASSPPVRMNRESAPVKSTSGRRAEWPGSWRPSACAL